jgi:hypothetical protein
MALRLRRGTNAERLLITPVEGELIYTTDTKLLYAGDGTTAGGTLVAAGAGGSTTLNELTDTDLTGATNNDVLKFNAGTNKWEPSDGSTLDALTDTDLTGAADGEVLQFNNATSKWESVAVPTLSAISLDDLTDVFLTSSPADAGDVLQFNGNHFVAVAAEELFNEQQNYKINIVGDDSTIMINTDNNNIVGSVITANSGFVGDLTGAVEGTVLGDLKGSVFADDSSLVIDGLTGNITTPTITTNSIATNAFYTDAGLEIFGEGFNIVAYNGTADSMTSKSPGDTIGYMSFATTYDSSGNNKLAVALAASLDATADLATAAPRSNLKWVIGNNSATTNIVATLDYIGNFSANVITPGTYADSTARDTAITTPTSGMMVFVTDVAKFQGYDGSAWVNLN